MENKPTNILFSIVIPTYNHAHLIGKCLNSIISQTYKKWEAIIINNYSEDSTIEVVNGFKDERIRIINFANNGIIAASRNEGIRNANGQWICFLDSDDYWHPAKLDEVFPYLEAYDIIYHDMFLVFETGKSFRKYINGRFLNADNPHLDLLLNGNACINSSVVVRKEIIEKVGLISEDRELISVEDFDYWLRIFKLTNRAKYLQKKLGYYLKSSISISFQGKHIAAIDKVYAKHLLNMESVKLQHEILCRKAFLQGRILQKLQHNKKAFFKYLQSVKSKNQKIKFLSLALIFVTGVFEMI